VCGVCIGQRLQRFLFPHWARFFFLTSFVFARNSGITSASFIRPLRWPLAGPSSVSFASKASVIFASKESRQRQEDRYVEGKKKPRGKKKKIVLPRLQVWLKKRGSVRPNIHRQVMSQLDVLLLTPCLRPRAQSMPKSACGQPGDRRNDGGGGARAPTKPTPASWPSLPTAPPPLAPDPPPLPAPLSPQAPKIQRRPAAAAPTRCPKRPEPSLPAA